MKNTALLISGLFLVVLSLSPADVDAQRGRCRRNAVFTSCGTACPRICGRPLPLVCTAQCVIGCVCRSGYILSRPGGECIPERQCRFGR